uniref:Uncharacterized protein n=1 Tax=Vibrio genomosp. F6 TaxID=723172 RepID=A0A0H3ZP88_9VIBR|nr:hypothetical protein [Vibrio genomosp. F6]
MMSLTSLYQYVLILQCIILFWNVHRETNRQSQWVKSAFILTSLLYLRFSPDTAFDIGLLLLSPGISSLLVLALMVEQKNSRNPRQEKTIHYLKSICILYLLLMCSSILFTFFDITTST